MKEWNLESGKGVDTPWSDDDVCLDEEREVLSKSEAKVFRRAAARINYMSLERIDLGHDSKEISKHMANPKVGDDRKIKRVIRYLIKCSQINYIHGFPRSHCGDGFVHG